MSDLYDEMTEAAVPAGFIMPSSPADRKAIMDCIIDISASKTRAAAETSFQSEALKDLSKKFNIPKPLLSRFARVYHKQNYKEELAVDSDFETLVEILLNAQAK